MADQLATMLQGGDLGALMGQMDKVVAPEQDQLTKDRAARQAATGRLVDITRQPLPQPKIQDLPKAPTAQTDQTTPNLIAAMSAPMFFLAMFGSRKSRMKMLPGINAATGLMQGFQQGQQDKIKLQREEWKDHLQETIQQNEAELEKYRAILERHKDDMAAAQAEITAEASNVQDDITLMNIKTGRFDRMLSIWN